MTWCGQCFAPVAAPAPTGQPAAYVPMRHVPTASAPPAVRWSRWEKTPTTFGPLGRVIATVGVVVPLLVMVVGGIVDPFVWGGAGIWGFVIMPWALRDIWKAGAVALG
jgi:hypothetical protein